MKKLKSSGYKGGSVVSPPKTIINPIEENIQKDLTNFQTLIEGRYIKKELDKNDIETYIQCLKEFIKVGTSHTGITTDFKLQHMISPIKRLLESQNLFPRHLTQQIEYFEKMLISKKQITPSKSRKKPTQGKLDEKNYKGGSVNKTINQSYNLNKEEKIKDDINTFLTKLNDSYLNSTYSKEDLECYIDCLKHLKSSTPITHYPKNNSLHKVANFTQVIFNNSEISITNLNQQIEGIVKILTTITPKVIEPKRTKPTQGKVSTLSKGYKK